MTEITSIETGIIAGTSNTVHFRGQEVTLKYPLYALMKLEETGVDLSNMDTEKVSITDLVKIVWAGLICQFQDATVEEVAFEFEMSDLEQLGAAMNTAFTKATGK